MKNQNKKIKNKGSNKLILIGIIGIVLISFAFLVIARDVLSPEDELAQLENELVVEGYDWLVNYHYYEKLNVYKMQTTV